jgi:peptidoglycan/LPS O-acetylase OafA/YrhL
MAIQTRNMRTSTVRVPSPYWQRLGDSSYALYLSHVFVVATLGYVFNSTISPLWRHDLLVSTGFVVLATMASIITGWLLHRWVEKSIGQLLSNRPKAVYRGQNALPKPL